MSRFWKEQELQGEDHDVSKELFLGIMMLMLSLGILIIHVGQPVWRVYQHDPEKGDVVILYTPAGLGLSRDGNTVVRPLQEADFKKLVQELVLQPEAELHLFLKGGSREVLVRHAALADSLLSADPAGNKIRPGVFVHGW